MATNSTPWLALLLTAALASAAPAIEPVDYQRHIQPLFERNCYQCHSAAKQQGDLRLDSRAALLRGGNSGPAIEPGKSGESIIVEAITGGPNASPMPPKGPKLSATEIALVKRWIDEGAPGARDEKASPLAARKSDHWSFQPIRRPTAPEPSGKHAGWARTPIDRFILARLGTAGLDPSPEADRRTLIRRVSLDLTGLPPSIAEVDAFLAESSEGAYERVVDRLLASPHYGERWGRHWLDLARYADSNGYTIDSARTIWKYRDWVIQSLNRDLPFDRFTIEQIAGDMLPKATTDQKVATGFHRNTMLNQEGGTDKEQFRVEAVVDRVSTTGSVFLGLTLGCARCHDHKYDPISQRDFYQFFALLNNADEPNCALPTTQQAKELPAVQAELVAVEKRLKEADGAIDSRQKEWEVKIIAQLAAIDSAGTAEDVLAIVAPIRAALIVPREKRTPAQRKLILDEYRKHDVERAPLMAQLMDVEQRLKQIKSNITSTLVMQERKEPRETFVHLRGDFLRPGVRVEPMVPAVLASVVPLQHAGEQANRLDLARWLVDARNPLTPRVAVNRAWQEYFGQGLVATENDFGTQGDRPTHPELLDWLASELVARGWSVKALHRLIVTSAVYRQASPLRAGLIEKDPYNKLLARQVRLRLDAEVIRDSALAASGLLSSEIGGPGVYPPQPEGIYRFTQTAKFWKESTGEDRYRRAMYTYFWRSSPYPFLTTFDAPDATNTCTRRVRSNTPLQALTLANDRAFFELAQGLAARVLRESAADDRSRIDRAVRLCLVRRPTDAELARLEKYVGSQRSLFASSSDAEAVAPKARPEKMSAAEGAVWTALARVVLNLDEFVTRE